MVWCFGATAKAVFVAETRSADQGLMGFQSIFCVNLFDKVVPEIVDQPSLIIPQPKEPKETLPVCTDLIAGIPENVWAPKADQIAAAVVLLLELLLFAHIVHQQPPKPHPQFCM